MEDRQYIVNLIAEAGYTVVRYQVTQIAADELNATYLAGQRVIKFPAQFPLPPYCPGFKVESVEESQ